MIMYRTPGVCLYLEASTFNEDPEQTSEAGFYAVDIETLMIALQ